MRRALIAFVALALVFGGVACTEDQQDTAGDVADEAEDVAKDRNVNIDNSTFEPKRLEITRGTEVTWVNQDDVQHTVTAEDDAFDSKELDENDEFSERFLEDGEFDYHCEIHGKDVMSGT